MTRIVLVTCMQWPELSVSDQLYATSLAERGLRVEAAPWNGPFDPFFAADLIVLRSNWDYHHHHQQFVDWLQELERHEKAVLNSLPMVRWNLDKRYLLDLIGKGVPVPETRVVEKDAAALLRTFAATGWESAVIKPAIGASGHQVHRLTPTNDEAAIAAWLAEIPHEQILLQEFMPEIERSGELSCVFFEGVFSHAALKRPAAGDFRVNSQYKGVVEPAQPPAEIVRQARGVLDALAEVPLYARVDGVVREGAFVLMELELNEPALMLQSDPDAPDRFADATVRRLESLGANRRPDSVSAENT